jgi:hypothetical protein
LGGSVLSVADAHSLAFLQHFFKLDLIASDIPAPECLQDFFVFYKSLTSPVLSHCEPRPTHALTPLHVTLLFPTTTPFPSSPPPVLVCDGCSFTGMIATANTIFLLLDIGNDTFTG